MPDAALRVAVVGATGAVGAVLLEVLAERRFPGRLQAFASARSAGRRLPYGGGELEVAALSDGALDGVDLAFLAAGGAVSRELAPAAARAGMVVIDKSSAFRLDPDVPLVVPEVNGETLAAHRGIVATPNCSTTQLVLALKPLHDAARLRHVTVATYQAVSGTGSAAVAELREQSRALLGGGEAAPAVYPHPIAFNALPQCDSFDGDETTEERKLVRETQRILGDESIGVSATCVRVPVWRGHSEAVWVEMEEPLAAREARELLAAAPGLRVVDDPAAAEYPHPAAAAGRDEVLVGRIRRDGSRRNGLAFFVVGDNLRKGAATNAVQIAEELLARDLLQRATAGAAG
jgi:aspartate-semialdehyde dehydrogenase